MKRTMLVLFTLLGTATDVVQAQYRTPSAFEGVAGEAPGHPAGNEVAALATGPQLFQDAPAPGSPGVAASILGSFGSFIGGYAGAFTGFLMSDDYDEVGAVLIGAGVGSVMGSTLGASIPTGNTGRALGGSILGGLLGIVVGAGMGELFGDGASIVGFAVTQGTVAGILAASGGDR